MQTQDQAPHPVLSKYDMDPGRWRPLFYPVTVSVPVAVGGIGRASLQLNNQPYVFTRITHQISGPTADPDTSGLFQDGQYKISFKDEISNYQKDYVMAESIGGSVRSGFVTNLPFPLPFAGNKSLTFEVQNMVARVLASEDEFFNVEITMHGVADWGKSMPSFPAQRRG